MLDIVFIILMFMIGIASFVMLIYTSIKKYEDKQKKKNELKEKGLNYNSIFSAEVNHIYGLPLAENTECIVHLCHNEIVIEGMGNIFRLQKSKIIDMNIKTYERVRDSVSGAISGAMVLGATGALLYGTSKQVTDFFKIIYKNKEDIEQTICFKLKDRGKEFSKICKYIRDFKENIIERTEKIEIKL